MDGNWLTAIMLGLMGRIVNVIADLLANIRDAVMIIAVKLIRHESLNPADFKKKDLIPVIGGVGSLILVIVILCIL